MNKSKIFIYSLTCLILISLTNISFGHSIPQLKLEKLAYEFLDVNQNPNKSFKQYADELIQLLKDIPECKVFCTKN